jgi:hypothetical protein
LNKIVDMRAIQGFLPKPRHTELMRIFVEATPAVAWQEARHLDLSNVPWVRFLFALRTFADSFHKHEQDQHPEKRLGIDQITSNTGFHIIHEEEGKEVVIGSIGRFWQVDIPFSPIVPAGFREFNKPGWGKLAWSISVEPFLTGSTICLELRTTATDDESWKKLNRYYHLIGIFSNLIRHTGMERLQDRLGKMKLPDDQTRLLAGDEILPETIYATTDHINIEAPPRLVWRYLMQLGCDRGGWYSIDLLDNGGRKSTDHLVVEWADREVGDKVAATPGKDVTFEVWKVEREKHFVMGSKTRTRDGEFKMSWAFVIEPIGSDATHLVVRAKMTMSREWKEWVMGSIIYPPVHGLMELIQLKTIKKYAERDAEFRDISAENQEPVLRLWNQQVEPASRIG